MLLYFQNIWKEKFLVSSFLLDTFINCQTKTFGHTVLNENGHHLSAFPWLASVSGSGHTWTPWRSLAPRTQHRHRWWEDARIWSRNFAPSRALWSGIHWAWLQRTQPCSNIHTFDDSPQTAINHHKWQLTWQKRHDRELFHTSCLLLWDYSVQISILHLIFACRTKVAVLATLQSEHRSNRCWFLHVSSLWLSMDQNINTQLLLLLDGVRNVLVDLLLILLCWQSALLELQPGSSDLCTVWEQSSSVSSFHRMYLRCMTFFLINQT